MIEESEFKNRENDTKVFAGKFPDKRPQLKDNMIC